MSEFLDTPTTSGAMNLHIFYIYRTWEITVLLLSQCRQRSLSRSMAGLQLWERKWRDAVKVFREHVHDTGWGGWVEMWALRSRPTDLTHESWSSSSVLLTLTCRCPVCVYWQHLVCSTSCAWFTAHRLRPSGASSWRSTGYYKSEAFKSKIVHKSDTHTDKHLCLCLFFFKPLPSKIN